MKSKKKITSKANKFKTAVENTPDVSSCFKSGLTALGKYSTKIAVSNTLQIQCSLDIDCCTSVKYPNSNRWDYALSYKNEVFFIEVHSANTSEVSTVLRKLRWLKDWLHQSAPGINKLKAKSKQPFYWIQSKGFAIPPNTPQYRMAVVAGLKPISILNLS